MMLLLFALGDERYGVEASQIVEVLPSLSVRPVPRMPSYVLGLFDYRGNMVPVLDVTRIYQKKFSSRQLSTRIIVVKTSATDSGPQFFGILAEQVTDTLKIDEQEVERLAVSEEKGTLMGEILLIQGQMIQQVDVDSLIPAYLYDRLFRQVEPNG